MIRVLMLDLGDTLIRNGRVLPHVPEALEAFAGMETAAGDELPGCLVSDFVMPEPRSDEAIARIFEDYVEILDRIELREFFEPVSQRVTLSTHVGVLKPERLVFETALRRLEVDVPLTDCLFITENPEHIRKARELGMQALQFGDPDSADFSDWANAPGLVAQLIDPGNPLNTAAALRSALSAHHQMELLDVVDVGASGRVEARVNAPHQLSDPKLGDWDGLYVPLPVDAQIQIDDQGRIESLGVGTPSRENQQEAIKFLESLIAKNQIGKGSSHEVELDARGRKCLTRKRFFSR